MRGITELRSNSGPVYLHPIGSICDNDRNEHIVVNLANKLWPKGSTYAAVTALMDPTISTYRTVLFLAVMLIETVNQLSSYFRGFFSC